VTPELGSVFGDRIKEVPLRAIKGLFYRAVPEPATIYALEDGPSYRFENRYNISNEFGALYFADRAEVCRATLDKRGLLTGRRVPYVLIRFDIEVDDILDLTDPDHLKTFELLPNRLTKTRETPGAYETPQSLAKAAYHSARVLGLWVPDASESGNTLVLYPGRLLARHFIRFRDRAVLS